MADRGNAIWGGERTTSVTLRYGLALVSVAAALGLAHIFLHFHLPQPFTAFALCAIALTFWYGGSKPGILAALLSMLVRSYFFDPETNFLSRVLYDLVFLIFALLMTQVTRARNELELRVAERTGELTRANEGLKLEIVERKHAENNLQRSESYLAEAQRLSHTGSWASMPAKGEIRYFSEECYRVLGFDPHGGQPRYESFLQRIVPDDQAKVREAVETAGRENAEFELDYRIVHPAGEIRDIHVVGHPVSSPSGDPLEFVGTVIDITERKRAEALRDGESRILEMIARDAPLEEILEKLVLVVEAQFAGLLCSVLLLDEDGQHARHVAAPNLPKAYAKAIDGLSIGPTAGSCGTAMYRREPVVVTDILQNPLWEAYRDVAEPYGFRACWSTPIVAHSGRTLGSFAMYYREPRSPSPAETRALKLATHLAGIAIERKLAREERERLRRAQADLAHINRVATMGELTASLAHEVNQPIAAAVTNAKT